MYGYLSFFAIFVMVQAFLVKAKTHIFFHVCTCFSFSLPFALTQFMRNRE